MAITTAMCNSFKTEILTGTHNFTASTGHSFKIALYTSSATVNKSTTAYSATNEVSGTGYSAGGTALTSVTPTLSTDTAVCDFSDVTWSSSTITANGALIYNTSASNKAVSSHAFGADKSSSGGNFTIVFPAADASNAVLRIA